MPASLNEDLTIITPTLSDYGNPRFANPPAVQPSYQNYTMIEDVLACQTALPPNTQMDQSMPPYNSNSLFPSYHQAVCPSATQQAFLNMARTAPTPNMYIPPQYQTGSFHQAVSSYNAAHPQYDTTFTYPPFAGSVPFMKHARASDQTIPLREGFANTNDKPVQTPTCIECAKHVNECNLCKKLTSCTDTRNKYITVIVLLIILIVILLCYIFMNKGSNASVARPITRLM